MRNLTTKSVISIAGVLGAAVVLAACGSGTDSSDHSAMTHPTATATASPAPGASAAAHNEADVMFASMMVPHHQQAIDMTAMVNGRTQNAELIELARKIDAAQGPEIEQMSAWLKQWNAQPGAMDHSSMGHGDGMMTPEQIDSLHQLTGPAFDKAWLEMMIEHHQGAVDMARTELAQGQNPDAKKLAQSIIDGQEAEIGQMKQMLAG
ncbi:DUF305 domain-containing protein [Speluncibacter jeojiensis]|uniref:DUF305 domain-containing protein n=1 Tax=Speluncibacter jeojiensis TaxID=2710754 RepID=A0A9X4RE05_9ACTN|nr:DUF305 domain-containing protein [Corynebacteriales bacterium D3-21]